MHAKHFSSVAHTVPRIPKNATSSASVSRFERRYRSLALEATSSSSSKSSKSSSSEDALESILRDDGNKEEGKKQTTTAQFSKEVEDVCSKGFDFALKTLDEKLVEAIKLDPVTGSGEDEKEDGELRTVLMRQKKGLELEKFAQEILECLATTTKTTTNKEKRVRAFARGVQVPKRSYALAELKLNDIDPVKLLAPTENTITNIKKKLVGLIGALVIGSSIVSSGANVVDAPFYAIKSFVFLSFLLAYDSVALNAGAQNLILDFAANATSEEYKLRLRRHEAGHFLVAYLTGVLPKGYTLSSLDAFKRFGRLNVQAGTLFCDGQFQNEVKSGKITSTSVGKYASVALAGVCAEYAKYGNSEGGLSDIQQLDQFFSALQFSQKKSDDEVRWATLNAMAIVRRHEGLIDELARMMGIGESTGKLISIIEARLANSEEKDI